MDNQFLSAKLSGGMNEEDGVVLCVTSTKSQPLLSKSGCVAVLTLPPRGIPGHSLLFLLTLTPRDIQDIIQ